LPTLAPAAAHYCAALAPLGIATDEFFFFLADQSRSGLPVHCGSWRRRTIHLPHRDSSRQRIREKNWPLDRWLALCGVAYNASKEPNCSSSRAKPNPPPIRALARLGTPAHDLPLNELVAGFRALPSVHWPRLRRQSSRGRHAACLACCSSVPPTQPCGRRPRHMPACCAPAPPSLPFPLPMCSGRFWRRWVELGLHSFAQKSAAFREHSRPFAVGRAINILLPSGRIARRAVDSAVVTYAQS